MRLSKASAYAISAALLASMSATGTQSHAETIDDQSDSDQMTSVNLSGILDDNVKNITTDVTIPIDPAMINQVIITGINDADLNQQLDALATNDVVTSAENSNSSPANNNHINNPDVNDANETNNNLATNDVIASAENSNSLSATNDHINNPDANAVNETNNNLATNDVVTSAENSNSSPVTNDHINNPDANAVNETNNNLTTNDVITSAENSNSLPAANDHINDPDENAVNETNNNLATNSVTNTTSTVNTNTVSADTNQVNNDSYLDSSDSISNKSVTSDKDDEKATNTHSVKSVTMTKSELADNYADLLLEAPSNDPITKGTYINGTFQTDIHRFLQIQQDIKSQPITVQKERPQHKDNRRSKTVQIPPVDYMINMIKRQLNWN